MTPAMLTGGQHLLLCVVPASHARRINVPQPIYMAQRSDMARTSDELLGGEPLALPQQSSYY